MASKKKSAKVEPPSNLDPKFLNGTYGCYGTGIFPAFSPGWSPLPPQIPRQTVALIGMVKFNGAGRLFAWSRINHDGAVSPDEPITLPSTSNGSYSVFTRYSGRITLESAGTTFDYVLADDGREIYMVQIAPSYLPGLAPPAQPPTLATPNLPVGGTILIIGKLLSSN